MLGVHGGCPAAGLQRQLRAGLHPGHHSHGPSNDAGDDFDFPAQWPGSVLGGHPAGYAQHDAGAGAFGVRPHNAGDGRDLCHTDSPDRARDPRSAGYVRVGNGRRKWFATIGFCGTGGRFCIHNG
jgi:hypothetical protein